jgi:hypothetical protein
MSCQETNSLEAILIKYDKLFYDKLTLVCVYIVILIVFLLMLYYFIKHFINILREYYREKAYNDVGKLNTNSKVDPNRDSENTRDKEADNEFYPVDAESTPPGNFTMKMPTKPSDHKDANEKRFIEDLNTKYADYNAQKTKYIQQKYNEDNDDKIDEQILYSKYDDYKYKKESKYD